MKRNKPRKIVLNRETLRPLEVDLSPEIAGASGPSCIYSGCGHTCFLGCTLRGCTTTTAQTVCP